MGRYLNPGNHLFRMARNTPTYLDKSGLIAHLNAMVLTQDRYVCVSRPRRFGKSTALNMIAAYYGRGVDSSELFEGAEICGDPSYGEHMNSYDVIQLNSQEMLLESGSVAKMLARATSLLTKELAATYPAVHLSEPELLSSVLSDVFAFSGRPFVILIDEWDCVFRDEGASDADQRAYLDFLRNLLKDRPYVALAYITGILPIRKYGPYSALNMFSEITMVNAWPLAEYSGFTEEDVDSLCTRYGRPLREMQRWYDGYVVNGVRLSNPRSVVLAAQRGVFDSYWTQTASFESLRRHIELDFDGLRASVVRLIAGESIAINEAKFQNDASVLDSADDVLTLLVHLGYLTYDFDTKRVSIPNSEVRQEFVNSIEDRGWDEVARAIKASDDLMKALLAGDERAVAEGVELAHEQNSSLLAYNDENALACILGLAFYAARRTYVIVREMPAGKGFADLVMVPRNGAVGPAVVIELKADGSGAETALDQIRDRRYQNGVEGLAGEVLLVGITYDRKTKVHSCRIETAEL